MNWSRGLFRAWMVFTVLWSIGVGIATYHQWPQKEQFAEHQTSQAYTGAFTISVLRRMERRTSISSRRLTVPDTTSHLQKGQRRTKSLHMRGSSSQMRWNTVNRFERIW